jgi:hypothetical protein
MRSLKSRQIGIGLFVLACFGTAAFGGDKVRQAAVCQSGSCAVRTFTTTEPVLVPANVVTTYTVQAEQTVVLAPVEVREVRKVRIRPVRISRLRLFGGGCCL